MYKSLITTAKRQRSWRFENKSFVILSDGLVPRFSYEIELFILTRNCPTHTAFAQSKLDDGKTNLS